MEPTVLDHHNDTPANYLYTNYCVPDVAGSALHLAAYNGRTATFRQLLLEPHANVHRRTADRHYATPLTVALARGHADIADICLQHLERDLAALDAHFARIGGPLYASRFWLRQRILIALGPDHVQFVRDHCAPLAAQPAHMRTSTDDAATAKSGLVILLKSSNASPAGVVWLTARRPGADRLLCRIVVHITDRGGELHLLRRDVFGCTDFDVAARMNHAALWMRLHAAAGVWLLDRRTYANSFRHLAELAEPAEARATYFADMCRRVGGFEVAELFEDVRSRLSYDVLSDAIVNYTGVSTLLDYLMEAATDRQLADNAAGGGRRAGATAAAFNRAPPDDWLQPLFGLTFGFDDNHLPWKCIRYRPTLAEGGECIWQTHLRRLLRHRFNRFDAATHALIVSQFGGWSTDVQRAAFADLCRAKWLVTVRELFEANGGDLCGDPDRCQRLLVETLAAGSYEVAEWLLLELAIDADRRLSALAAWLAIEEVGTDDVPETLWSALLAGDAAGWNGGAVSKVLCQALFGRHWRAYQRVWTLVEGTMVRKGNRIRYSP